MKYTTRQIGNQKYVDFSEDYRGENDQAALEIVGICREEGTDRVMLHSANLPDDFFWLSSGLAGNILLKFFNYSIRAAVIVDPERVHQGKFYEFAVETNRGNQFRIFYDRQKAGEWLTRD